MNQSKENSIKYEVCFIQTGKSPEEATDNLKLAFEAMDSNQLDPYWLSEAECLKFTQKEAKLFVMDPFEGKTFEHLKSIRCRIVGPLCILYCLQYGDVLPKRPHPVYSVSMRKITVSCSNINNTQREDIFKKVELMGGFFSKDFTKSVTHLVVGEVGSKKYQVAANFGLPIMTPEWIEDVWLVGQHKQVHASDSCYNKYKCPVFKGLVITVSQLSTEERNAIQTIIQSHGGKYLPPLKAHETTHLVLSEPSGDKYRYAKTWKIFCVNVNWIYESVEAGYCKDENLYKVESSSKDQVLKRSTPNRDLTLELPPVDCSVINNVSAVTHLDETMKSDISIPIYSKNSSRFSSLETFDVANLPKYGQFLDGCKFYLTGFNSPHLDKLRKIVNAGGGMRFNKYSESITHVVCSDLTNDILKMVKSFSVQPYIISSDWLLECCKKQQLVEEKPFLVMDVNVLSPEKNESESKKSSLNSSSQMKIDVPPVDNISEILNQYLPDKSESGADTVINNKILKSKSKNDTTLENKTCSTNSTLTKAAQNIEKFIDLTDDEPLQGTAQLFAGLKFLIAGFGDKDTDLLTGAINDHSGTVLNSGDTVTADIAIVPIIKHDYELNALNIITNCWLQKCIEDSRIYDFTENELFTPVEVQLDKKPFASLVISVSQYCGTERDCLMHLAEVMGATCQEYFVRKANKSRGILSNTHLVAATPEGNKYTAAKKWKIPVVIKQWILDAAKMGEVPLVDNYLIDNTFNSNNNTSVVSAANVSKNKSSALSKKSESNCSNIQNPNLQKNVKAVEVEIIDPLPGPSTSRQSLKPSIPPVLPKAVEKIMSPIMPRNMSKLMSPLMSKLESSSNDSWESIDLNKSYKHKFRISGILNELDSSARDQSSNMKRCSVPVEDLFGKNLASAVKGFNCTMNSESEYSNLDCEQSLKEEPKVNINKNDTLKDVVLCVSKKLNSLQHELNEIVASMGGDYVWTYENMCTHFVFSGKLNDLSKDFREAKSSGKKIVCPEWVYACKEQNCHVDENLYPHTLKFNMSLANEIAIVKNTVIKAHNEKENIIQGELNKDVPPIGGTAADFNKQLDELLVAAKSAKRRHSKRLANSVSSSPVSEPNKIQRPVSDSYIKPIQIEENQTQDEPDTGSQFSQPYPIVWDDPTGRLEREKIAAKAAISNSGGNTKPPTMANLVLEISPVKIDLEEFNMSKNISIKTEKSEPILPVQIKKFMFTNIPDPKKEKFISIIKELGGEVSDEKTFDITATHLILEKPIKNEKLLSSAASGKWVVHSKYLIDSEEQNRFLSEETYEWGGPSTVEFAHNLPSASKKIAGCPFRWRTYLSGDANIKGAFHDWTVVVIAEDKGKQMTYIKILEAGAAKIVSFDSSSKCVDELTHVIVDMKKRSLSQLDLDPYVSNNIKCVKPEYLAFYLIEDPPPNVENFILPEAKDLMGGSSSKRRTLSISTRGSKRSKIS